MEIEFDGKTVFAATGGQPFRKDRPVLVFVHGSGCDHTVWALQTRYFAHRGTSVLAVDLPGHGRSEGPALTSIEQLADWLAGLLDELGVSQAAVVGHSMGSLVALALAARHGTRVRALALLGTALPMAVADPLLDAAKANDHAAMEMITLWGHSKSAQIGGGQAPGAWVTGTGLRLLERAAPDVLYHDLKACNDFKLDEAALAAIECPVLLIVGAKDVMTPPAAANALSDALPRARMARIDGCGHMMMAEKPDQVLDALKTLG